MRNRDLIGISFAVAMGITMAPGLKSMLDTTFTVIEYPFCAAGKLIEGGTAAKPHWIHWACWTAK